MKIKEILLVILLALLVRLPWLMMVPQVEAPDEINHMWVIKFLAENLHLPDYQSVMSVGPDAVYGSIPQFGYLPHFLLFKCVPADFIAHYGLYAARAGGVLMSLLLVGISFYVGRILFLPNHIAALALPLLIVFHPQFVMVTSYTNNDSTSAALASLILLLLIGALSKGLNKQIVLLLGLSLSLLVLSKYTGYPILLAVLLFIPIIIWLHRGQLKEQIQNSFILIGVVLLLTVWWFIRNNAQFAGDITGLRTMHRIWAITYKRSINSFQNPITIISDSSFWRMLFYSFWGWFGPMTRQLPTVIYQAYLVLAILAVGRMLFGVKQTAINFFHRLKLFANTNVLAIENIGLGKARIEQLRAWIWLLFFICAISNLIACVYACSTGVAGPQGRYLFPSEIPIMAMFIAGLEARYDKWSDSLIISLLIFNFIVYCYATISLYYIYAQGLY